MTTVTSRGFSGSFRLYVPGTRSMRLILCVPVSAFNFSNNDLLMLARVFSPISATFNGCFKTQ